MFSSHQRTEGFGVGVADFLGVLIIVVTVNLLTNLSAGIADELSAWWSIWAFLGSGIGLAVHGFVVRLNRPEQIGKVLNRNVR